ncbi:hypothetical protein TD95_000665 [Thielaviopsis punctulata]|uniref:Enoyl reductase (ER) domain-containing protein n=1 Tax=Thielaviopsis punctulata TaxID=72032 RepID=A0A0F4ZGF2_9PEZI|nr:hypothetical protein TD95_000665 [Thielaviopsis punctulata]
MASRILTLEKVDGKPGQVYYPLKCTTVDPPKPGPGQIVVHMLAVALNHRDLFIRKHLYPAISFSTPLLSDGCGTVTELGPDCQKPSLLGKRVILAPSVHWTSSPDGPEDPSKFSVVGASKLTPLGTAADFVVVDEADVEIAPEHLSPVECAAIPVVGLTAWRALVTKSGNAQAGRNILVTGIGGGVALTALQFGTAMGCNVYVTSSSAEKLEKAKKMGAAGGVSYKSETWVQELQVLLPKNRPYIDAIIDGAGGNIVGVGTKLMKAGGVVVCYGMTQSPKMDWLMQAVLKNIELKGSTMGSRKEYADMMGFIRDRKITPVISRVVKGLDNIEAIDGLFKDINNGVQFGKLVIEIDTPEEPSSRL